ncbi:MAG: hypothetical protein II271_00985, partial [Muribaculaceae bacterium]|nr:hypothetical protein [Muribaculaceae bacterium]
ALVCLTLDKPKLGGGSEKLQTSLLFRSPCTNFAKYNIYVYEDISDKWTKSESFGSKRAGGLWHYVL